MLSFLGIFLVTLLALEFPNSFASTELFVYNCYAGYYFALLFFLCFKDVLVVAEQTNEEDEEVQHALAASMGSMKEISGTISKDEGEIITDKEEETSLPKKPTYPLLPEEPSGDKSRICRVGVRLPDGRRAQRNFLRVDPIQVRNRKEFRIYLDLTEQASLTLGRSSYVSKNVLASPSRIILLP